MDIFILILILILLLYLPGYLTLGPIFYKKDDNDRPDFIERQFLYITISFVVSSLILLSLAELEFFKLPYIITAISVYIILAVILGQIFGFRFRINKLYNSIIENITLELAILLVLILVTFIIYLRPFEWIYGWRDPGVYVNTAVNIARTGKILIDDPTMARIQHDFVQFPGPTLRFPGFYINNKGTGVVYPQFFHLFTVWLAFFYLIAGLEKALILNAIFGILGLLSVYIFTRRSFNKPTAFLVYILLGINTVQLYFSRYPTTEVMTQFLVFASILMLTIYFHFKQKIYMFLAGATFGLVFILRIDAIFLILSLYLIFLYIFIYKRDQYKIWPFALSFGVMSILAYIQITFFATRYTNDVLMHTTAGNIHFLLYALIAGVILFIIAGIFSTFIKKISLKLSRLDKTIRFVLAGLTIAVGLYGYFVRPYSSFTIPFLENSWSKSSFIFMSWYISIPGIILAFLGIGLYLYHEYELDKLSFASIALVPAVVYLLNPLISQDFIYVMRRFLPIILPALIIFMAYIIIYFLWPWKKDGSLKLFWPAAIIAGLVLAVYLMAFNIKTIKPYINYVEYKGAIADLDMIDSTLDRISKKDRLIIMEPTSILLAGWIAEPLNFLYPENTVFVYKHKNIKKMISQLDETGLSKEKEIFIMSNDKYKPEDIDDFDLKNIDFHITTITSFERRVDRPPRRIEVFVNPIYIYYLNNK